MATYALDQLGQVMAARAFNQLKLAAAVGISPRALRAILKGTVKPRASTVTKLCKVLNAQPHQLGLAPDPYAIPAAQVTGVQSIEVSPRHWQRRYPLPMGNVVLVVDIPMPKASLALLPMLEAGADSAFNFIATWTRHHCLAKHAQAQANGTELQWRWEYDRAMQAVAHDGNDMLQSMGIKFDNLFQVKNEYHELRALKLSLVVEPAKTA